MGCGGSHGTGGVLGLEDTAELYIFGVRSNEMRAVVLAQKACIHPVPVDGGCQPWWWSLGKLGCFTP